MGKVQLLSIPRWLPLLAAAAILVSAAPSRAAPMCENAAGVPVQCGHPGAMPLGWTVSPQQREIYLKTLPPDPSPTILFSLACLIGAFFALIALMPDFDGRTDSDWGRQEGDE